MKFYEKRQKKLVRQFDRVMKTGHKFLEENHGKEFASITVPEMRKELITIIPELPYVGGNANFYTNIIIINGMILAIWRVMKKHNKSVEDVIELSIFLTDHYLNKIPKWIARIGGRFLSGRIARRSLKKQAVKSQLKEYPEDWLYTVEDGDKVNNDMIMDFSECAVIKLYQKYDAMELAPYCNFADVLMSKAMNLGLVCNPHLGSGGKTCNFQYKRGRETPIPDNLKKFFHDN